MKLQYSQQSQKQLRQPCLQYTINRPMLKDTVWKDPTVSCQWVKYQNPSLSMSACCVDAVICFIQTEVSHCRWVAAGEGVCQHLSQDACRTLRAKLLTSLANSPAVKKIWRPCRGKFSAPRFQNYKSVVSRHRESLSEPLRVRSLLRPCTHTHRRTQALVVSRLLHGANTSWSGCEGVFHWRGASLAATFGCFAAQTVTRLAPCRVGRCWSGARWKKCILPRFAPLPNAPSFKSDPQPPPTSKSSDIWEENKKKK